jgi:hypothetical protein
MSMLEKEDATTFKNLGWNFAVIIAVAVALIVMSVYFS